VALPEWEQDPDYTVTHFSSGEYTDELSVTYYGGPPQMPGGLGQFAIPAAVRVAFPFQYVNPNNPKDCGPIIGNYSADYLLGTPVSTTVAPYTGYSYNYSGSATKSGWWEGKELLAIDWQGAQRVEMTYEGDAGAVATGTATNSGSFDSRVLPTNTVNRWVWPKGHGISIPATAALPKAGARRYRLGNQVIPYLQGVNGVVAGGTGSGSQEVLQHLSLFDLRYPVYTWYDRGAIVGGQYQSSSRLVARVGALEIDEEVFTGDSGLRPNYANDQANQLAVDRDGNLLRESLHRE
jgi:hypothetical protein